MKKLLIAFTTIALIGSVADAGKITCRKPNGQIGKVGVDCPAKDTAVAAAGGKISAPDAKGKCRVVVPAPGTKQKKGQFVTCPK